MFTQESSVLVVIDIQGKLAPLVHDKDQLYKNVQTLIKVAQIFEIPILWTEQAPEKIGVTVAEIQYLLTTIEPIEKVTFSCCPNKEFSDALQGLNRKQVIVTGIETHVCVYQTVQDLLDTKFDVQVVTDAVSSRTKENRDIALERMRSKGADLTCTEMVVCELMRSAEHEKFRDVMKLIK